MALTDKSQFKSFITSLYRPRVVVLTTEKVREDFSFASQTEYSPFNSFSSFLEKVNDSYDISATQGSSKTIFLRPGDQKLRTLSHFSVQFVEPQIPWSTFNAQEHLIRSFSEHPRYREELGLRRKPFPLYSPKEKQCLAPKATDNNMVGFEDSNDLLVSPECNEMLPRPWIAAYPHTMIRQTEVYLKSSYDNRQVSLDVTDEMTIYDMCYLQLLRDSYLGTHLINTSDWSWNKWMMHYSRMLDDYEDNTLSIPYTFVYFVSSRDEDPVVAIQELMESSVAASRYMPEINTGRCFVVVGRECNQTGDSDSDNVALHLIKEAYPPSSCHSFFLTSSSKPDNFYMESQVALRDLAFVIITHTVIPTLERVLKRLSDNSAHQSSGFRNQLRNLWTRGTRSLGANRFFTENTIENTAEILWGSYGSGAASKTKLVSKGKELGGSVPHVISEGEAANIGHDLAAKICADLLFFLGEYTQAALSYRHSASEFRHQKCVTKQAQAVELLGICLCLSSTVSKAELDPIFDEAITLFRSAQRLPLALRTQMIYCQALHCFDKKRFSSDIAEKYHTFAFDHFSELYESPTLSDQEKNIMGGLVSCNAYRDLQESPIEIISGIIQRRLMGVVEGKGIDGWYLRSAVLLEQAATSYKLSPEKNHRKSLFYSILAGHSYSKSGLKSHAMACYSYALPYVGDSRWHCISDHILFSLARQASSLELLADSVIFFFHLIENLLLQSMDEAEHYSIPLYSRSTAFNHTAFYYLLPDSLTLPRASTLLKPSFILNADREAAYMKEALYIFTMWNTQMMNRFASLSGASQTSSYLKAFHQIHYELPFPCLHNHYDFRLDSEVYGENLESLVVSDELWTRVEDALQITLSHREKENLTWLLKPQRPTVGRVADEKTIAVHETIHVRVRLYNPLLIPVDCHHFRVVWTLSDSRDSTFSPIFMSEPDHSCVVSDSLTVTLKALEKKTIELKITPVKKGYLKIHGLAWELYRVIKVFIPFYSTTVRQSRKRTLQKLSVHPHLFYDIVYPQTCPDHLHDFSSCAVFNEREEEPVSPVHPSSITPTTLLKEAVLVSQVLSSQRYNQQKSLWYHVNTNGTFYVSSNYPYVGWQWNPWPSELHHGERFSVKLTLVNRGDVNITAIRSVCLDQPFCIFHHQDRFSVSFESHETLVCGQRFEINLLLRGSYVGSHQLTFLLALDFTCIEQGKTCTFRRWLVLHNTLEVTELLDICVNHYPSTTSISKFNVAFLFRCLPNMAHSKDSGVTIKKALCFLPHTEFKLPLTCLDVMDGTTMFPLCITSQSPVQRVMSLEYLHPCRLKTMDKTNHTRVDTEDNLAMFLLLCSSRHQNESPEKDELISPFLFTPPSNTTIGPSSCTVDRQEEAVVNYVIYWEKGHRHGELILFNKRLIPQVSPRLRCQLSFPSSRFDCDLVNHMDDINAMMRPKQGSCWGLHLAHLSLYNISLTLSYRVSVNLGAEFLDSIDDAALHCNGSSDVFTRSPYSFYQCISTDQRSFYPLSQNIPSDHLVESALQETPKSNKSGVSFSDVHRLTIRDTDQIFFLGSSQTMSLVLAPGEIHVTELFLWLPIKGLYTLKIQNLISVAVSPCSSEKVTGKHDKHCHLEVPEVFLIYAAPSLKELQLSVSKNRSHGVDTLNESIEP